MERCEATGQNQRELIGTLRSLLRDPQRFGYGHSRHYTGAAGQSFSQRECAQAPAASPASLIGFPEAQSLTSRIFDTLS